MDIHTISRVLSNQGIVHVVVADIAVEPNPKFSNWVLPTLKSIRDSKIHMRRSRSSYYSTQEIVDLYKHSGIVKRIPYKWFNGDDFAPYTLEDLRKKEYASNVPKILQGFLSNSKMPMPIGTISKSGTINITDGYTRSGVAMGLNIKIYACLLPV